MAKTPQDRYLGRAAASARPLVGRLLAPSDVPAGDLLVEAEYAYDARDVMPRIQTPVLMLSGTTDLFFPPSIVDETQ